MKSFWLKVKAGVRRTPLKVDDRLTDRICESAGKVKRKDCEGWIKPQCLFSKIAWMKKEIFITVKVSCLILSCSHYVINWTIGVRTSWLSIIRSIYNSRNRSIFLVAYCGLYSLRISINSFHSIINKTLSLFLNKNKSVK